MAGVVERVNGRGFGHGDVEGNVLRVASVGMTICVEAVANG